MTVAVAHRVSTSSRLVLIEAAREAAQRGTELHVLHVTASLDLDSQEAYRAGISDEVEKALAAAAISAVETKIHLGSGEDEVAETLLTLAAQADADLIVIGARRRSPVGKFLMGSIAQQIILDAPMPVLVVKAAD